MNPNHRPSESDESTTDHSSLQRRRLLGGLAGVTCASTTGCLGLFTDARSEPNPPHTDREYTTVPGTKTFSHRGTRTPFPSVDSIYAGEPSGILVIAYYDYSHGPSLKWWREEYPKLSDLIVDGKLRLTLLMFPKPVDRWSVMLPSALFEVRHRVGREAAVRFHEGLVAANDYSLSLVRELATGVGADPDAVVTAAETRRRRNQAFADKKMGTSSGVDSLPGFRWGMERIDGTSAADIRAFIEERTG